MRLRKLLKEQDTTWSRKFAYGGLPSCQENSSMAAKGLSKKNRNFTPDRTSDPSGESHEFTGKFLGHCPWQSYIYKM